VSDLGRFLWLLGGLGLLFAGLSGAVRLSAGDDLEAASQAATLVVLSAAAAALPALVLVAAARRPLLAALWAVLGSHGAVVLGGAALMLLVPRGTEALGPALMAFLLVLLAWWGAAVLGLLIRGLLALLRR
jgi:hypothetical protein